MGISYMVSSGKGGTGKSTISVYLAEALARAGSTSLVIELDSGLRSVDVISGVYGHTVYDIEDVLLGRCTPAQAIVQSPRYSNMNVLCAPYNSKTIPLQRFVDLCNALAQNYDYLIIDTAAGVGDAFFAASAVAMRALVIATPDPVSVRDARIVVDKLREQQLNDIRLIINKLQPSHITTGVVPNLDYCIDHIGARLIGVIPDTTEIVLASAHGTALKHGSVPDRVFDNIAKRVAGEDTPLLIY